MKHYLSKILDNIDVIVYVADFRTYEILYINEYTKKLFGNIEGKICWQSLQKRQDGPCSFCTNDRIITSEGTPTGVYHWEFQNTITGQWFDILDTAIEWKDGHFVRLEVATDITEHKKTELALIESEKKYHSLVSNIPSVTWITDSDGKTIFISPNVEKIYGYTPDEIYKYADKLWFERIHPEDVKKVKEEYKKLFKKGGCFDIEYRIKRKDEKWIWLHDRAVTTYEKEGMQFAYGVFDDITDRKRYEDSLRESEERFRQLAENITEVFYISNLQTNRMLYISPGYEILWGRSCESLYSNPHSFIEAIHPDCQEQVKHSLERQLQGKNTEEVYRIIRPDRVSRWVRDRAFPVRDANGNVVRVIGIAEDITYQKISEAKIREGKEHYHCLLDISPDAIVETGLDGKILFCNQQASIMHGYESPTELIGQDSLQLMHEEDIHIAQKNAELLLDNGYFRNMTYRMRKKDGTSIPVEVSASLVTDDKGIPKSFIGYIRDITKRKAAEEEKEWLNAELIIKNKELEQVLYVTSHDLRSPLVNVNGYSKELDYSLKKLMSSIEHDTDLSSIKEKIASVIKEDIPESLYYIQKSVSKMETLIKGILTLSRLGSSKRKIEVIDMNEMMTSIIDNHQFVLNELKIKTDVSTLPDCKGDSAQLNQVFSNLLDNAIKYSASERSCVIHISGYQDNNHSVYCVEDNGIGIAPEHQDKIFEIFQQLQVRRLKGEGMGLTIAYRIIEKHNGKIWVESELGRGSKFFISLPKE